MTVQVRPSPAAATNPWSDWVGWSSPNYPLPGIWEFDGTYENFYWDTSLWNTVNYFAYDLGFSSIGSETVTKVIVNMLGIGTPGIMTSVSAGVFLGIGDSASFVPGPAGPTVKVFPTGSPTDVSIEFDLTGLPAVASYVKTNMTNSLFNIGLTLDSPNASDDWFIDNWTFEIWSQPAGGPSIQKRFLKSFSSILTPV